jgi:nucleoside-diphosphate-sugar epimerase
MRIFVTGGTGYIGSAVLRALLRAGHAVTGLVRSAERAAQLEALGARAVVGTLRAKEQYATVAAAQDASVYLGFESGPEAASADLCAVETLLSAARASGRPYSVVYTSGCLVLGPAGPSPAFEDASTAHAIVNTWRPPHERLVLDANTEKVATAVIRPGWVYGGDVGLISGYFESAVKEGAAAFIGDGHNRMPLVEREDVAALYLLALERRATGILHAFEEGGGGRVQDYAAAASRAAGAKGAVRSIPLEEARRTLGPYGEALCIDQWVGSKRAEALGFKPKPSFLQRATEAFADWQSTRTAR